MKYVIRTSYGAFMTLHSNEEEMYPTVTSIDDAAKYTKAEVVNLYDKFGTYLNKSALKCEVHEIVLTTKKSELFNDFLKS